MGSSSSLQCGGSDATSAEPGGDARVMCVLADQAVRLWLLCPSVQRGSQEEVPGGHALLDGAGGHLQVTVRH